MKGSKAHRLAICAGGAGGVDVQVDGLPVVVNLQVPHLRQDELRHSRHQLQPSSRLRVGSLSGVGYGVCGLPPAWL